VSTTLHHLYRDLIVDHSKRPRNFRRLGGRAMLAEEYNPLCGDSVTVYVELADGVLHDVAFEGVGCAVSTASASLMTEAVQGRSAAAVAELCDSFRSLVTDGVQPASIEARGGLAVFTGVRGFPSRVKCALLPWRALRKALHWSE
jgi:nitrogen fixation NifU-like protein